MKRTLLILGMVVGLVGFMTIGAMATPVDVNGSITFSASSVTFDTGSLLTATEIASIGTVSVSNGTVDYASTVGASPVFFQKFGFEGSNLTATPFQLWAFQDNGLTYSFEATSLSVVTQNSNYLNVGGNGLAHISGGNYNYTAGTWSFTSTSTGGGLFTFGASSTTEIPEPATLLLLGIGLLGLGLLGLRKKGKI